MRIDNVRDGNLKKEKTGFPETLSLSLSGHTGSYSIKPQFVLI